ncbi:DUF4440 domain-containing protein [Spongiivirga citrea]|uniref:DUF4440 domain-containing protein n=1 Tax=Spongiivirga citrea TaxID=1481457 RepID=A0A6M0CKR6_9FLAO|nr:DUF4440 domain-containing protein [Spongiivirga citrea]NER17583.1 DUF4440 domain-containing protein [Spongiivirga citrea]
MRSFFILLFFLIPFYTIAQTDSTAIQNEINDIVWKPFKQAFSKLDAAALNALYANEVLRVTPDGIDTEELFKTKNIKRFKESSSAGVSIVLDFWFDSRHTNKRYSYEVGFYRIAATLNGKTTYNYGQFHIVLQKINGQWKITQDWDTTTINGHTISKIDFGKQKPITF